MFESIGYTYLGPRQGSNYRQFFIKGTRIRAETLYRQIVGPQKLQPEEVAQSYRVPLAAVQECIRYCEVSEPLLREERNEELVSIRERGLDKPPFVPNESAPQAQGGSNGA